MQENPFTLMFGKVASSIVPRRDTVHSIIEEFEKDSPKTKLICLPAFVAAERQSFCAKPHVFYANMVGLS